MNATPVCQQRRTVAVCFACVIGVCFAETGSAAFAGVWTYEVPQGEQFRSPDYEVTVEQHGTTHNAFVHYSRGLTKYTKYEWAWAGKGQPLGTKPGEVRTYEDRGTCAHSAAIFSFTGKITVRVKVKQNAQYISLPLRSAKILPSSYNIPCTIENGNTIVFSLDRPEKVIVFPNYDQAWEVFVDRSRGHVPIQSWRDDYAVEKQRASFHGQQLKQSLKEGYKNPLIILAHPQERDLPEKHARGTLVVHPGTTVTQSQLDKYDTVWFEPGIHDLVNMGVAPGQTLVKRGQTVYLEGGAYVMARFQRNDDLGIGPATIKGRGVISGIKHQWVLSFEKASQVINIDNLEGVTITDRGSFGIYGGHHINDIAMLGAWHGNTDGPDYLDNCVIENSFLMAHDDNLKLNHNTHARHLVIWQLANAHAIMVKEMRDHVTFADSVVEDVDIVAYFKEPTTWKHAWGRLGMGAIACVTGSNLQVQNFTFRDIRIESPYLFRVFSIYNLDTNRAYTPSWFSPTSKTRHTRINGMTFEKINVNSPVIAYRSLLGSAYEDSLENLRFVDLRINGTLVTEQNEDQFFEIERDKIKSLEFSTTAGRTSR